MTDEQVGSAQTAGVQRCQQALCDDGGKHGCGGVLRRRALASPRSIIGHGCQTRREWRNHLVPIAVRLAAARFKDDDRSLLADLQGWRQRSGRGGRDAENDQSANREAFHWHGATPLVTALAGRSRTTCAAGGEGACSGVMLLERGEADFNTQAGRVLQATYFAFAPCAALPAC